MARVYSPTNKNDFSPHGFLDHDSAQQWIDDNVLEAYRPQWHIANTVVYADYVEYKKEMGC